MKIPVMGSILIVCRLKVRKSIMKNGIAAQFVPKRLTPLQLQQTGASVHIIIH
jgi:hypothetical protein